MQSHPTPSAHVCTTLPPGNLPMRDTYPDISAPTMLALESQCGRVRQFFMRQLAAKFPQVPIGTWSINETRIDEDGEAWIKVDQGIHYVVDDFGFLARVNGKGGAA